MNERDTGGFGRVTDTGGFGRARGTDGFDAVRDSGEFSAIRDSDGFSAVGDPGGYDPLRDSGGFRALPPAPPPPGPQVPGPDPRAARAGYPYGRGGRPDGGGYGPDRRDQPGGQPPRRRKLRYTPTVAASGPMTAVPPPAEFNDPRPSGSFRTPDDSGTSSWFTPTDTGPQAQPQSQPGLGRHTGPQARPGPPRTSGPQAASPWTSGSQAAARHGTGPQPWTPSHESGPQPWDAPPHTSDPYPTDRRMTGPQPTNRRMTGPQPGDRRMTGPQPADRRMTGPQPAERRMTGPQPTPRRPTGPQPTARRMTGPQPADPYMTGPQAATRYPADAKPDTRRMTGPQPTNRRMTGPQPADRRMTGPQPTPRRPTGPQPTARRMTGPQPAPPHPSGPQRLTGPQRPSGPPHPSGPQRLSGRPSGPQRTGRPSGPQRLTGQQRPTGQRRPSALDRDSLDGQRGNGTLRRLRELADHQPEPRAGARVAKAFVKTIRSRNWVTGLAVPILAAIAVGIAVVVIVGANHGSGGPAPSTLSAGFPPARSAAADFTDTPALAGRGISGPLGQVAAVSGSIVAVGSQSGGRIARARFYYSADAGRTWQLGTVQAKGGASPPPGQAATLVAGGARGWVAVGPTSVWTSQNGQHWLLGSSLPQIAGDQVTTLTATGSGFLAAGQNIPGADAAKATPVVWLSANGTTWQRLGATRLGLRAAAGGVLGITSVAANGNVIEMAGKVAGTPASSQVWRSSDGGTSWTPVTVPVSAGAAPAISGLAPLKGGFLAVRSAVIDGFVRAAVYVSPDGTAWHQSQVLTTGDNAPLTIGLVSGGPGGAVVTGEAHGLLFAFLSPDGVTWTGTDPVGTTAGEQIGGVALTSAGQAVFAATGLGGTAGQPLLTLIGAHGGPAQVNMRAIPGAASTQVAVNAIAASDAAQVAAGSADGQPALWVSKDGGSSWVRGVGASAGVLTRPGEEQLTAVADGAAGWLAVGGGLATTPGVTTPATPVVVGSADGRTWTAVGGGSAFIGPGQVVTSAVATGQHGFVYVIVGHETSGGHTVATAWYAPGITGWLRAGDAQPGALDGAGDRQMNAVTGTAKGFAAVGSTGSRPAAWLSANGRTWSAVTLPLPGGAVRAELQYVAANGNTVAATGTEVTANGQQLPFAAVSANGGTTWTETALPAPGANGPTAVTALAAAGGGFTATGTYGAPGNEDVVVWMLARGAAPGTGWAVAAGSGAGLSGPGTQAITALTQTGSTLTGVGFTATPASEEPTIWQSPIRS